MPFNGSGTFTRVMNWMNDAAAAIKIKADRHDQNDDDIAAGLSNCITKDGQTLPTADIPMNGKKLVNLGAPTVDTDAVTKTYADTADALKAPLASPAFTGVPTAPTAAAGNNSTQLATTAYVDAGRLGANAQVITDWNTAIANGWYEGNGAANAPPSTITGTTAWVYGRVESYGTGYAIQTVWPASTAVADADTHTAMRVFSAGVWSAWFRVRHSETEMNAIYARKDSINTFATGQNINPPGIGIIGQNGANVGTGLVVSSPNNAGAAAFISLNRTGLYAVNFGLDTDNQLKVGGWSMGANAYKIWHEGNDGPGSGLNADLLDGYTTSMSVPSANTVPVRDAAGDITVRLLRTEYGVAGMTGAYFLTQNAIGTTANNADNYARPMSLADVRSTINGDALVGSIGSYAYLCNDTLATITPGQGVAGSALQYGAGSNGGGGHPAGSWRCMGYVNSNRLPTVYVRYA